MSNEPRSQCLRPLSIVSQVSGNFLFDSANHRDFLGAILGTGVAREKVGDILVTGEQGAQVLVAPELVGHFETALTQVLTLFVCQLNLSNALTFEMRVMGDKWMSNAIGLYSTEI